MKPPMPGEGRASTACIVIIIIYQYVFEFPILVLCLEYETFIRGVMLSALNLFIGKYYIEIHWNNIKN